MGARGPGRGSRALTGTEDIKGIETARVQERQSHTDMVAPRLVLWAKGLPSLSLRVLGCRTGVTEALGGWAPAERPGRCGVRRRAQGLRKGTCWPFSFLLALHCRRASGFPWARPCSRPQGRSTGPQANRLALGAPLPGLRLLLGPGPERASRGAASALGRRSQPGRGAWIVAPRAASHAQVSQDKIGKILFSPCQAAGRQDWMDGGSPGPLCPQYFLRNCLYGH